MSFKNNAAFLQQRPASQSVGRILVAQRSCGILYHFGTNADEVINFLCLASAMFPRKAPARQSVFSYNNRVVVKRAECMAHAVFIVDKEEFMLWMMLMVKISLVWKPLLIRLGVSL